MPIYASDIVKQAQTWIGKNEKDGSHKEIIDVYNSHKPLARGYAVRYNDAWCATFVSAVAIKCGATSIIPTECSCNEMINLFQKLDCWIEDDAYVPSPGMVIFYDWQDNGVGDCKGSSDHVGIVETVNGSTMTIIEGNYSDAVKRRTIKVNGKFIRGYGAPKYATKTVDNPLKVGSKVQLTSDAVYYDGKSIPSWVKKSVLYVREVKGDRVVVSTQKSGAITGAVNKRYLKIL